MIAFGVSATEAAAYHTFAEPGIELVAESDSQVYVVAAVGQITRSYNLLLSMAGTNDDLEALVLVHPHTRILDPQFCVKVRQALRDPDVAVAGISGASGVGTIAWWRGRISSGPLTQRYEQHGGGEMPALRWADVESAPREVDTVDGYVMALSPWAVHNLRFDEALALGHGFDFDYCQQARAAGRKVVTMDVAALRQQSLHLLDESVDIWVEAHIDAAEKWDGRLPGQVREHSATEEDWKRRARRAEAEMEAARAVAYGVGLQGDARVLSLENRLRQIKHSRSWRLTRPLRAVNRWRVGLRERD